MRMMALYSDFLGGQVIFLLTKASRCKDEHLVESRTWLIGWTHLLQDYGKY